MGLFTKESVAQRYLRSAPSGQRKDILSAVCMNRIAALPVAATTEFGQPVTDTYGLEPSAEVVRAVLIQDRSMYAWVARSCMVILDSALEVGPGNWAENLGTAMQSVGIAPDNRLRSDLQAKLPESVQERVLGLHGWCMNIFWVVAQPHVKDDRDRTIYRHMFESTDNRTELTAHDVAAWAAVVVGRLRNSGMLPDSPFYSAEYANVPTMDEPGWYPNPYNYGEIVRGEASFQRVWDGRDWTSRIRFLRGARWHEETHSLHTMPNN